MSIKIKEKIYKLIWRWYLAMVKLNQIDANYSRLGWRGCHKIGTYFHMWQEYKNIEILAIVFKEISKLNSVVCPKVVLLF